MSNYKHIEDLQAYVFQELESGVVLVVAKKTARIAARLGFPGEYVLTWSVDARGQAVIEKESIVSLDENGIPDWVVTKLDTRERIAIDTNRHDNCWVISNDVFCKKYEPAADKPGIYKPASEIQQFLPLHEAIHIVQCGQELKADQGGYINITTPNDMYVISGRDFDSTYVIIASMVPNTVSFW